jgi:hypothetical protein
MGVLDHTPWAVSARTARGGEIVMFAMLVLTMLLKDITEPSPPATARFIASATWLAAVDASSLSFCPAHVKRNVSLTRYMTRSRIIMELTVIISSAEI